MTQVFDPHAHIRTVFVVGVGGTGAQVARLLARILYDMRRARLQTPQLTLVDPDMVEAKNIGRQAFAPADIGHSKAEIVARRLSWIFGLDIGWSCETFDPKRHLTDYGTPLLLSCVDNHEARQVIHSTRGVLISSGNAARHGQVTIGNADDWRLVTPHLDSDRPLRYLPKAGLLFPELLQPDPTPTPQPAPSCGERIASGEQHLMVNDWQALVMANYAHKLLHREPITTFLTHINADDGLVLSKPLSDLIHYLPQK